jgi:hypothetical protein
VAGLAGQRQSRQEIVMNATSPQGTTPATPARKATSRRRTLGILIAVTTSLLSLGLTGPAFAMTVPHAGEGTPGPAIPLATPTVKVISTGVSTWQVALIAIGTALLGAAAVLLASRLRTARWAAAASAA